ncbi:SsgA family sporulation/cell division regulator [Streptomyces sp. NPDC006692]|uniref:SsgA family sporulation/cell division regulator n=1 Tax=unclassified Streptomyces TaxID=2593676 RepID=UPI0034368A05
METQFDMRLVSPAPARVKARLRYSPATPLVVEITFDLGEEFSPVTWTLGRDLLRDGLSGPAGMGDAQIGPTAPESRTLLLGLYSPGGSAEFRLPRQALGDFLRSTAKLVPYGREAEAPGFLASLDRALASMLAETR